MSEEAEADMKSVREEGDGVTPTQSGRKTPNSARVNTPDSTGRPKSTASGDIVFEAKKKRKRGGTASSSNLDDAHEVTFTVTICMAIPTALADLSDPEHDDQPADIREILKKRMIDAPRPQNYYHLEYSLMPEEDELMKTDIVTYGVACKIYMERHDARVVKTWQDGDITWFSWAHSHTVTVTKDVLLKMFNHTIELRVWDTKDKCSTRARFDRPKAFRLPAPKPGEKPEDIGGVKAMVTKQMKNFVTQQPKKGIPIRPLPSQVSLPSLLDSRKASHSVPESRRSRSGLITPSASSKILVAVPNKDGKDSRAFSRLGQLAGADRLEERSSPRDKKGGGNSGNASSKKDKSSPSTPVKSPSNSRAPTRSRATSVDMQDDKSTNKVNSNKEDRELRKQLADQAKARAEHIKKHGVCMIPLRLALLFGDKKIITNRLESPLPGVEDVFLGVSLSAPLLSPTQKQDLNPLSVQIKSATNMPSTPLSYADLQLKCHPVYCKYKFFKEKQYLTPSKDHSKDIYWEDTNVFLLGTMEESELREYFSGPAMEIEVHDRDRRPEEVTLKPMLFGDDLEDEKIANVGTVESRRTLHNPFQGRNKPWDPYGTAKVDLSELLLGHRFLEMKVPIHKCPIPDVLGGQSINDKLVGIAGAVDGPIERPMTAGDYICDTAMLKVKVELAHPLITPAKLAAKEPIVTTKQCPFNRIIFIFGYRNLQLLNELQSLIRQCNAKALELDDMPQHVIDAALSTYKLSVDQQCSLDLDIVTGFHLLDGEYHTFVLEGLRDRAIRKLWADLPQPENSDVKVLYNSDMSFGQRLYGPLDVDLCRVKLHEPLSIIVQQSLLYVRDMVVRPCFDGLIKMDQVIKLDTMKDVVRNDLFPAAEMIVSMSREFGVPFTQKDLQELQETPATDDNSKSDEPMWQPTPYQAEPSRNWTPLDNFNQVYMDKLRKGGEERHDYLEENIQEVQRQSERVHQENERNKKPRMVLNMDPAFNYSTMALNSVDLAHKKLREYLREQDPDARYAYNQEFMSAMYTPVDVVEERKLAEMESKSRWRTSKGWTFPGMKSTKESNVHSRRLDPASLDALKEEWVENHLHTNMFKSPLDRDRFPWVIRKDDLDLYTKPEPDFGNKEPFSIHLPGVLKEEEKKLMKEKYHDEWKDKIVVDDVNQYFHRVLPETEMRDGGFKCSNQLDRQKPLLKDSVVKKGLQLGTNVNDIPPFCVVNDPLLDTQARARGLPLGPAIPEAVKDRFVGFNPGPYTHCWSQNNNHIPCQDYRHFLFQLMKGDDLNVYHKNRNTFSKRPIPPLQPHEKEDNHLFRVPVFSASPYQRPLPAVTPRSLTAQPNLHGRGGHSDVNAESNNNNNNNNNSDNKLEKNSQADGKPSSHANEPSNTAAATGGVVSRSGEGKKESLPPSPPTVNNKNNNSIRPTVTTTMPVRDTCVGIVDSSNVPQSMADPPLQTVQAMA